MKRVVVDLTEKEATHLLAATTNTLGHADACDAVFKNRHERNAAFRASDNITGALHEEPAPVPPRRILMRLLADIVSNDYSVEGDNRMSHAITQARKILKIPHE